MEEEQKKGMRRGSLLMETVRHKSELQKEKKLSAGKTMYTHLKASSVNMVMVRPTRESMMPTMEMILRANSASGGVLASS